MYMSFMKYLHESGYCLADLRSCDDRDDDLCGIARKIRDHADSESWRQSSFQAGLQAMPYQTRSDCHTEDHADHMHIDLCRELLNEEADDRCKEDKTDEISAGRSEKLADTRRKIRRIPEVLRFPGADIRHSSLRKALFQEYMP